MAYTTQSQTISCSACTTCTLRHCAAVIYAWFFSSFVSLNVCLRIANVRIEEQCAEAKGATLEQQIMTQREQRQTKRTTQYNLSDFHSIIVIYCN